MTGLELRGRIFDVGSGRAEPGVVVTDSETGRITEVRPGTPPAGSADPGVRVIETTGTILPGFVDAHMHLMGARRYDLLEWTTNPPVLAALRCVPDLRRLVEAGFTAVRDLGSKAGPDLKRAVEEGYLLGPKIVTSGRSLAQTGGDDDPISFPPDIAARLAYSLFCDGPWECRRAVRQVAREGATVIKVYASGSFIQGTRVLPQLSSEEIEAIVTEAHQLGLRVAAHAYGEGPIRTAVEAGVDTIEHGIGLTEELCELLRRRGTYYVPTLSAYATVRTSTHGEKRALIDRHFSRDMELALRTGVSIVAGTDYAGVDTEPHGQNAVEMIELVKAGMAPVDALRAATLVGAQCLGLEGHGQLREGFVADLVTVAGSPETAIDHVKAERVEHVVLDGRLVK